jgi:hypothetical protein
MMTRCVAIVSYVEPSPAAFILVSPCLDPSSRRARKSGPEGVALTRVSTLMQASVASVGIIRTG